MPTVFFIGATGCIGSECLHVQELCVFSAHILHLLGTVLEIFVKAYPSFTYKALVRNESAVTALNDALGSTNVQPVKGTFDDVDLITQLTFEADFVINTADSDNVSLKDALLKGFKQRFDEGKGLGGLIQTSGCAIYFDGLKEGRRNPEGKVWTVSDTVC